MRSYRLSRNKANHVGLLNQQRSSSAVWIGRQNAFYHQWRAASPFTAFVSLSFFFFFTFPEGFSPGLDIILPHQCAFSFSNDIHKAQGCCNSAFWSYFPTKDRVPADSAKGEEEVGATVWAIRIQPQKELDGATKSKRMIFFAPLNCFHPFCHFHMFLIPVITLPSTYMFLIRQSGLALTAGVLNTNTGHTILHHLCLFMWQNFKTVIWFF